MKKTALFSLNDTSDVVGFAESLIDRGWEIVASSETVALLKERGLPVIDVADFTGVREDFGFPPTLHAKIEYALTGDGQPRIDLVYVIPYPRACGNDVGGRTLLALAVKGARLAVMNVKDMQRVVSEIVERGEVNTAFRQELADKACLEIAQHYLSLIRDRDEHDFISGRFSGALMNGENPYQVPASVFACDEEPLALTSFRQVSGEAPCFTNMADADCILTTICLAAEAFEINTGRIPYLCVAAKHGNPCGLGFSDNSPAEAIERALFGNPQALWGGEVIVNFPVDGLAGKLLFRSQRRKDLFKDGHWMLDVVMAPSFEPEAVLLLGERRGRKLFENGALLAPHLKKTGFSYRPVRGGFLRQPPATYVLNLSKCRQEEPGIAATDLPSLLIAWAVAFSSCHGGNEIALARDGALIGAGGGPSTVEAARVAICRAADCGHDTRGAAFAADAFFPFTDAPSLLVEAGTSVGCVPAGGRHESSVMDLFTSRGMRVAYIPPEFRGFCRH